MKKKQGKQQEIGIKFVKNLANWDKNGIHNLILERICSIIDFSRVKKFKKESGFYFKKKIKILYKINF